MSIKRFNYALDTVWYANESRYKNDYLESIVFIHKSNGEGVAIYTQGSYFPTSANLNNLNELINILSEGNNITITSTTDAQGKIIDLKIGAVSLSSLKNITEEDKGKLVNAQSVINAFDGASSSLIYTPTSENQSSYTFLQLFNKLDGSKSDIYPTVKITSGNKIDLTANNTNGLIINHETITQLNDVEINKVLSSEDNEFTTETYIIDNYGHVTGKVINTITLPEEAFKDTVSEMTASINEENGIDIKLSNNNTPDINTITIESGDNVNIALIDNKIQISSNYENDDTTYSINSESTESGININLIDSNNEIQSIKFEGSGDTSISSIEGVVNIDSKKYTGERSISVNPDENKITLVIDSNDTILENTTSGLKTTFDITYNESDNKIYLTDKNGNKFGDGFDTSKFIQDSFLKNAEIVTEKIENNETISGNFLKLTFDIADDTGDSTVYEKVIYIDIKDFYTKTTISGDAATYSSITKTGDDYKVSNILGTIVRSNVENKITVHKDGLATVNDIYSIINTYNHTHTVGTTIPGYVNVVTGIKLELGKVSVSDTTLIPSKNTIDTLIATATTTVIPSSDLESKKYLSIDESNDETDNHNIYTVKVSGIDKAINDAISKIDVGVETIKTSTVSKYISVNPNNESKGNVIINVDVISVDATDTDSYQALGLATDAYVNEKIDNAMTPTSGSVKLTNTDRGGYLFSQESEGFITSEHLAEIMTEAWTWGFIE